MREHFSDTKIWAENQDIQDWKFYVTLPLLLTFNYEKNNFDEIFNIGPIYLIFSIAGIVVFLQKRKGQLRENNVTTALGIIILFQFFAWLLFSDFVSWYVFSAFLLILPLMGIPLEAKRNRIIQMSITGAILSLSITTVVIRLDKTFRNSTLFVREDNGSYPVYEVSRFINQNNLSGLIWNHGTPFMYYVENSESKVVYDWHPLIFHYLYKKYGGDRVAEKLKSINVSYFIFDEGDARYWSNLSKKAEDVSPQSSQLFRESIANFDTFREHYLTKIFRSGNIAIYSWR